MNLDKSKPVMVSGATGYVASWLVKKLLEEGFTVHAAVRDPNKKEKIQHLDKIARESQGEIKYFKTDLLDKGSYAEAMKGCELVFHTASPFISYVKNPQMELIDPAVRGTRNILKQANETTSVKRIVVTSSCAAIYGDAIDCAQYPNKELTEEHWNTTSSIDHNAYSLSKTLAEKEAWKIANEQDRWDLVTVNPSFVLGPFLNPKYTTSESFNIMKQMGDGTLKMGCPKMGVGVVDVRDLADVHFEAGFNPKAKGRYIGSGTNTNLFEMSQELIPEFGVDYPLPKKIAPKWMIMLFGPMMNKSLTRKFINRNINHEFKANNSKSRTELGISYRPLGETMRDTFQAMVEAGAFAD